MAMPSEERRRKATCSNHHGLGWLGLPADRVGPSTTQTVLTVEWGILAAGSKDLLTDPLAAW